MQCTNLSGQLKVSLILLLLFLTGVSLSLSAEKIDSLRYEGEVRASFSAGENTPFWLVNNLQGLGNPEKNSGFVRAALYKDIDESNRFSWGAGIDLAGAWRNTSPFYIHQLYGEVKYRSLDALIGSKVIYDAYNDPKLSSGSLLYSVNALPIPQVRLGIFDYADFWGCKGWFSVKGYIAYGMFTDSSWQKSWADPDAKRNEDVLYHSKGLWLRGGNSERFPLQAEVGIEMATQFGGVSYKDGKVVDMRPSLKDWLTAFFPTKNSTETFLGTEKSIDGNMLGQYTIAISWRPKADWSVRGYFEHFFEDQSMMTFEYGWKDGLWGIEAELPKNKFVSKVVYEFLYTKDQAGAVNNDSSEKVPEQVSGRDSYYGHSVYTGWQHWGMGIGNPLLLSPIYNSNHHLTFLDNRIIAHHFAIAGNPTDEIDYRVLLSFSKNWGTYTCPTEEVLSNFNALAEVTWHPNRFKGWYGSVGLACDTGSLLGKSMGIALTIGKTGFFGTNRKTRR
jgi:hypothetical protein